MAIQFRVKTNNFLLIGVKNAIIQLKNYGFFKYKIIVIDNNWRETNENEKNYRYNSYCF